MKTSLLSYTLPAGCIADHPSRIRRRCRLLRLDRASGAVSHHRFDQLPSLLNRGDLLVVNNTAVIPARLLGRREPGGGEAEVFLLEKLGPRRWKAMVRPGRRLRPGAVVTFGNHSPFSVRVDAVSADGTRTITFTGRGRFADWLRRYGAMPLPPYINRAAQTSDRRDYQTVFARCAGAVASPTAGLHFDQPLIRRLKKAGMTLAELTLHVGAGTFRPIRTETVEAHRLDSERYQIGVRTQKQIRARHLNRSGRVIAVGTTVTRTLESVEIPGSPRASRRVARGGAAAPVTPLAGATDLLIAPGHRFRNVDALITNFHLPGSSLLALVAAMAGLDAVMNAYREAIAAGYRFYSYGDAMLII